VPVGDDNRHKLLQSEQQDEKLHDSENGRGDSRQRDGVPGDRKYMPKHSLKKKDSIYVIRGRGLCIDPEIGSHDLRADSIFRPSDCSLVALPTSPFQSILPPITNKQSMLHANIHREGFGRATWGTGPWFEAMVFQGDCM
jgi:hypothetical protein